MDFWPQLALGILATWRITHLLVKEDGPADLVVRFRARLGHGIVGKLMDCFECLSLWVAVPIAFLVSGRPLDLLLIWLGLSGGACLLERVGQEPVVIQPMPQTTEGDTDIGMLRSETSGANARTGSSGHTA
jgi:hypothetical protein